MDKKQLEIFASVSETNNFTRTAEQLYITQPAVSHQINLLEQEIGVKLIERSKRGVSLTPEGEEFLLYARHILEIMSAASKTVQNMSQGSVGHIRIASLFHLTEYLCDCLSGMYSQCPSMQIDVDVLAGYELMDALRKEEHDFYFAVINMVTEHKEYDYTVIGKDYLTLFYNRKYENMIDIDNWDSFMTLPFISIQKMDGKLSEMIWHTCQKHGINPNIINLYNRAEAALLAVQSGLGVAVLPGDLGKLYHMPDVEAVPIIERDAEMIAICAWKNRKMSMTCENFKEIVLKTSKSL